MHSLHKCPIWVNVMLPLRSRSFLGRFAPSNRVLNETDILERIGKGSLDKTQRDF